MPNTVEVLINLRGQFADQLRAYGQAATTFSANIETSMRGAAGAVAEFDTAMARSGQALPGSLSMAGDAFERFEQTASQSTTGVSEEFEAVSDGAGAMSNDVGLTFGAIADDAAGLRDDVATHLGDAGESFGGLATDADAAAVDTGASFDAIVTDAGAFGQDLAGEMGDAGDAMASLVDDASATETNVGASFDGIASDAEALANDLDASAGDAGRSLSGIGDLASGLGDVVGTAAAVVITKFEKITTTLSAGFDALTGDYSKIPELLGMIPGPVGDVAAAVGGSLANIMQDTVDTAEHFRKLQDRTGATVEFLSGFTEVADDYRITSDTVGGALEIMSKKLGGIADMSEGFNPKVAGVEKTLQDLGISARDAAGQLRPMEELIPAIADAFMTMPEGPEKTAVAVELFGRRGAELIPVLNQGAQAMAENMEAARKLGLVYSQEVVDSVDKAMAMQDNFNDMLEGAKRTVGAELAPEVSRYLGILTDYTNQQRDSNNVVEKALAPFGAWIRALTGGVSETEKAVNAERERQRATEAMMRSQEEAKEAELAATRAREEAGTRLIEKTTRTVAAYEEYDEAAMKAARAEWALDEATKQHEQEALHLKEAQEQLHESMVKVIGAVTNQAAAMDAAERIQTALKLATGEMTITEFENRQAVEAVMKAVDEKIISEDEATKTVLELAEGNIDAEDAFIRAGKAGAQMKQETDGVKDSAERAKGPVKDVGDALGNITSKDVTLTVKGKRDTSYTSTEMDYRGFQSDTAVKTVQGNKTSSFNNAESHYHGVHNDSATKTTLGNKTPSFMDAEGAYLGIQDAGALKTIYGRADGSFTANASSYNSVVNGSATATIHVSTDVQVNWNGPYSSGNAAALFPGANPADPRGSAALVGQRPSMNFSQPVTVIGRDLQIGQSVARQIRELARVQQLRAAMGAA